MRVKTNSSIPVSSAVLPRRRWPIGLVWFVALAAAPVWTGCSRNDGAADGPVKIRAEGHNILLVTMDTTRVDALGCYGAANASTPHLDRLAQEGVRLTRCSTCSSLTLPSHASMLTGYYPFVHGLRNNGTRRLADSFDTLPEILKRAGYATGAEIASAVMNANYGLNQGFDTYQDVVTDGRQDVYPQRRGDDICNAAIEQLRKLSQGKFFLWVHFYDPHDPYDPPGYVGPPGRPAYAAEITFMDTQIGRLIDELKRLGVDKKTLVALVSDHGEGLGDHGEGGHGYFVYETTVHVPFILWCPGTIPAGRTIDAVTRTVDVFPTLLELVGLSGPEDVHGVSLVSLLQGEIKDLAGTAYAESLTAHLRFGMAPLRSLSVDRYKYVWAPTPGLHDLLTDPDEMRNVIREYADIAHGAHSQLRTLVEQAPPAPSAQDAALGRDDSSLDAIRSMGYAGGSGGEHIRSEIDIFEPVGADPRTHIEDINRDNEAILAMTREDYRTAETLLRQTLTAFPDSPKVIVDLAVSLAKMERLEESCDLLHRALELDPDAEKVRLAYAEYLLKAGRYDEALAQLDALLQNDPTDGLLWRNKGLAMFGKGNVEEATKLLEKAASLSPTDFRPIRGLALVHFASERYAEAETLLAAALEALPHNALLCTDLGYAVQKQGRTDEATRLYARAIELDPAAPEPRKHLAALLQSEDRWSDALDQYDRLVDQFAYEPSLLVQRAEILSRLGRSTAAIADLERAHGLHPNDRAILRQLVLALIDGNRAPDAVRLLRQGMAQRSAEPGVLGLLAYAIQQTGDLVEANRLYQQAIERAPDNPDLRTWYGGLLQLREMPNEAAAEFERAIAIKPDAMDARYSLGQVQAQQGHIEAARGHFEHILKIEPANVRALHAMGVLNARQQNWAEAARYFEQALGINPSHQPSQRDLARVRRRMQEQPTP